MLSVPDRRRSFGVHKHFAILVFFLFTTESVSTKFGKYNLLRIGQYQSKKSKEKNVNINDGIYLIHSLVNDFGGERVC